ncbi:MAG: hypothetical protein WCK00_17955, partial [Deltaproteobacteria bacterium]
MASSIGPAAPQVKGDEPAPAKVHPIKQPHEMTKAEYRHYENAPKVEAIQQAIRQGKQIINATYSKATSLTSPDHIKISSDGTARIAAGRKFVALTDDALNNLAGQAGMKIPAIQDRVYHREIVKQAIKDGQTIPPEVMAEYPKLRIVAKQQAKRAPRPSKSTNPLNAVVQAIKKEGGLGLGRKAGISISGEGLLSFMDEKTVRGERLPGKRGLYGGLMQKFGPGLVTNNPARNDIDSIAKDKGYGSGEDLVRALMGETVSRQFDAEEGITATEAETDHIENLVDKDLEKYAIEKQEEHDEAA